MKYLSAYLLLSLGGNESPSKEDVSALLTGAGVEVDAAAVDLMMGKLEGKSVTELMAAGKEKLVSIGGGGGGGAAAGGATGAGAAAEEEKEEEVEEAAEVDVGGGGLFGGDDEGY